MAKPAKLTTPRPGPAAESRGRPSSRSRILDAAIALAREQGPGHLSLEAVAERAGVSKGGLLYNFATKAELMQAVAEHHVAEISAFVDAAAERHAGSPNPVARAFVEAFRETCGAEKKSPSGILAAIAEDPGLVEPIRNYHRKLVGRIRETSPDPDLAIVAFLAVEGLRALQLFECDPLSGKERDDVLARLTALLGARKPA